VIASLTFAICWIRQTWLRLFASPSPSWTPCRSRSASSARPERPPAAADLLRVLEALPLRTVAPIVLLEQTGVRSRELASSVLAADGLRVKAGKTAGPRVIPLQPWLSYALRRAIAGTDAPANEVGAPMNPKAVAAALRRACREARVAPFTLHALRRRRLELWFRQGISPEEIGRRLGVGAHLLRRLFPASKVDRDLSKDELERVLGRPPASRTGEPATAAVDVEPADGAEANLPVRHRLSGTVSITRIARRLSHVYVVYYSVGDGRVARIHGGTFKTLAEAEALTARIRDVLAVGGNPAVHLAELADASKNGEPPSDG